MCSEVLIYTSHFYILQKKKKIAEQFCSTSSLAPYPHLIHPCLFSLPKGQTWWECLPTSFRHHAEVQGSPQCLTLLAWEVSFHLVRLSIHKQVMQYHDTRSANRSSDVMDGKIIHLPMFSMNWSRFCSNRAISVLPLVWGGRGKPRKAFCLFFLPLQDQIFAQAFYIFDSKVRRGISNYIRRAHPCFEFSVVIYTNTKQLQNSTWKRSRTLHLLPGSTSAYNTRCKGDTALPHSTVYTRMRDPSKDR